MTTKQYSQIESQIIADTLNERALDLQEMKMAMVILHRRGKQHQKLVDLFVWHIGA